MSIRFTFSPEPFQLFDHREPYPLGELAHDAPLGSLSVGRLDGIEIANLHGISAHRLHDQASWREYPVEAIAHHRLDWQLVLDRHSKGPVMKIADLSRSGSSPFPLLTELGPADVDPVTRSGERKDLKAQRPRGRLF